MGSNPTKAETIFLTTKSVEAFMQVNIEEFQNRWDHPIKNNAKLDDFERLRTLGSGAFGCVVLVRYKSAKAFYAMKVLDKDKIIKMHQVEHTLNEKRVLQAVKFPFLVALFFSFKDNANLYLVLEFIAGGEMFTYLRRIARMSEYQAKIYAAQVVMVFEYLHGLDIIYRDLKPENILIDPVGYIKVTDLGFAKRIKNRTYTLCGTPEYLAPEVIHNKGYGKAVDWWTLGILIFEMASGYPPFMATEHLTIYEKIIEGKYKFPRYFSSDVRDICRHLIQADLTHRYGNLKNGALDVKNHPWFKDMNWVAIYEKRLSPPYVPPSRGAGDAGNFSIQHEYTIKSSPANKYANEFKEF